MSPGINGKQCAFQGSGWQKTDTAMTKTEFTARFAQRAGLAQAEAERLLAAILDSIEDGLFKDGRLTLRGFGSFDTPMSKARRGRNPATGEVLEIPAAKTVRFRPADILRELLN